MVPINEDENLCPYESYIFTLDPPPNKHEKSIYIINMNYIPIPN